MLRLENTEFIYEPYPVGLAKGVFEDNYYQSLVKTFPPKDNFVFMEYLGNKYSLSELNNADIYHKYIISCQPWHDFYKWVKSKNFINYIFKVLENNNVDLGIHNYSVGKVQGKSATFKDIFRQFSFDLAKESSLSKPKLSARFEFSMLPANGGYIKPHTDAPGKIITLVIPMVNEGDWSHSWGGGTEIMRPKDVTKSFNLLNKQLEFNEVQTVETFDFSPNQCLIFVKTFNSLHAVRPMKGDNSSFMRSTLTINIETKG